jgi:hypothetical protein
MENVKNITNIEDMINHICEFLRKRKYLIKSQNIELFAKYCPCLKMEEKYKIYVMDRYIKVGERLFG